MGWGVVATDDGRPLAAVGVAVTREEGADGPLTRALRERGARVVHWAAVRAAPPADDGPLRAALAALPSFDWVVFTSPGTVRSVARHLGPWPRGVRVAVVGRATGEVVGERGWPVDLVPAVQTADGLVAALGEAGVGPGMRVLFPASEIAGRTLEEGLPPLGATVHRVTAYRTLPVPVDRAAAVGAVAAGQVRVVAFASPSAVANLRAALGGGAFERVAADTVAAAIGPTTAAALRAAGVARVIEAADHSFTGLADRIAGWAGTETETGQEPDELSDP